MKKLLTLASLLSLIGTVTLNSHIIESTKNIFNDFTFRNNISWDDADLSKFTIKHIWDSKNIQNNDININYFDFKRYPVDNIQQKIYMALAYAIDNKYQVIENKYFTLNFLYNIVKNEDYNLIGVSILDQSDNSSEPINNDPHSFQLFTINPNEIKSFNLKIFNSKSFFNVSVNICNFDTDTKQILANKNQEKSLNTSMFPDTNQTSVDNDVTDVFGFHPHDTETFIPDYIDAGTPYNLHIFYSNAMPFSAIYPTNVDGSTKQAYWNGDPNDPNTPGHIDLTKISSEFTSVDTAKFFLNDFVIQSDIALEDWCIPNSNSHTQDFSDIIVGLSMNNILSYELVTDKNGSFPWNHLPDASVTSSIYYISKSQYNHDFWAGSIYYAGFMVLTYSNLNNHTLDAFAIFTWKLNGVVYAKIKLKFAVHSNEIGYYFNNSIFANNPN